MAPSEVKVSAPATVANLGPGYDIVGLALDRPRDVLMVKLSNSGRESLVITGVGGETISTIPERNSCSVAARAVLVSAGRGELRLEMDLVKGVPPRMGMGSSGASSAAGAFAANELLGSPLGVDELLACAMEGEKAACGAAHADNVAPSLFGGITVMVGMNPPKLIRLEPPRDVSIVIVSPKIQVGDEKTKMAREVIPKSVPLSVVVGQVSAFSSLILGIVRGDAALMGRGISGDLIIEPARANLIPGFGHSKEAALAAGAHGFSISGAGPSVFALCPQSKGKAVAEAIAKSFKDEGLESTYGCYSCGREGALVVR
jgi:homoserine kinase